MRTLLVLIVALWITCATATSDESSEASSSEENVSFSSSDENSSSSSSIESTECTINYRFTIWIGDNVHSVNLNSECGIVFLNAMQQASLKKEQFRFEYTAHPLFGALVTQMDGVLNDDETNTYWMLYDLTAEPDVANAPADKYLSPMVVNSLKVLDGHSYLFWYKTSNVRANMDQYEDY